MPNFSRRMGASVAGMLSLAACASGGLERTPFRASANEPFFTVEVDGSQGLVRTIDGGEWRLPVTRRVATAAGARIELSNGRSHASVDLHGKPCQDDMSGADFPLTALITIDGVTNNGCARRLSDPPPRPR